MVEPVDGFDLCGGEVVIPIQVVEATSTSPQVRTNKRHQSHQRSRD
jgi:hypothetical protein